MSILEEFRVCTRCARDQPLANFKRRSKAQLQRLSWCKDCVNAAARERTSRKRSAALGQFLKNVRHDSSEAQIVAVVSAATRRLGGAEGLGRRIADLLENDDPDIAFRAMEFVLCLIHAPVATDELSRSCHKACRTAKKSARQR